MNRKTFSLVTSLAILTSSLSPTWAAGKDFTYNNLNQNLPIKAPVDETKEAKEKIDLPLVTETLPDESVRDKYARIIFVPETKIVNNVIEYGKLKDESGNIIPVSKNYYTSAEKKYFYIGKDYYVLKSAGWSDVLNYKEDGKLILPKLEVENNESDPEKKKIHKFLGWSLSNNLRDPFNLKKYKKVSDIGTSDTLEFKSRFENSPYFYGTKTTPIYDLDGYKVEEFSKRYNYNEFTSFSYLSRWRGELSPNEKQKEFADPKDFPSKRIYFYFKKNSGTYKFGDYKPSIVNEKNYTFWYWCYDGAHGNIAWDSFDMYDNAREFKAIFINKFFRIPDNIDLEKLPSPEGIFVVRLEAEKGYTVEGLTFTRNAVRGGVSLAEVTSIPKEPELIDENNVKYEGKVAWYYGYKKINNPSEFKINSDIVLTARPVKDYESEKFTAQVKKIEVNKGEDVTLEKLKTGIVNLPKNLDKIEIKTYPDTSKVGESKAVLKLIFSDTSSKEVEIPVKVINIIDAGIVTPVPEIKVDDIIKEEVPYNGQINLLDNIKNLPDGAKVEDISDTINTKISGTYTGKVKVIFKDGSSRIVVIPVKVSEALADSYTPQVKKIEVNKDELLTREKLKTGIVNLPKNLDKIEIKTYPDTSKVGEGKATLKLIFTDTSSKEVEIPVRVIEKISGGEITPIPTINDSDIIKEEVPYNGEINLLDNIKNLPDGAEVEDISDPIDTKVPGTYKGKVKVIFKDGSSRIVVIPVKVSEALASSYTPEIKTIEVNKGEDVTLEKLKSGITNLPENIKDIEIVENVNTSKVGEGKATLKLIFTDTSSKEVVIPVKVIEKISGGEITPIPKINESDIIKEEVPYNGQINLLDNIKNLPDGVKVEDVSEKINTKISGTYTGKVKITFKDGSSRIVVIPVEVSEALSYSYTPQVKKIEVNKGEDVTLEKLKTGIVNLPKNLDKIEIKTYPDTSKVGEGKATLKLIFTDTSSKEVEIPVRVIEKISGGEITPIPTINDSDIIKEEVPYNGEINLLDNIKNLPDGAKVEDISDPIDTKIPGTYTGKIKITFKDESSRIVEIPIEVLTPMAEEFPVRNPVKTQVENLENLSYLKKSEIEEKVREANPQVASIDVDDRGNVTLIYEDGSSNLIKAEDIIILREKTPEEEDPEEKPGEEDDKNPEDKQGEKDNKDPEDNKDKDKEKEDSKDNEVKEDSKDYEEEDNKKTENKRGSWNDFPRYYVRNHRTPTYKVETKITYKESKSQVNAKKFVINMKTGTYTTIEDGKTLERNMEVKPLIKDDRTFLPLRTLADILDAKVIWNEGTRTASFTRDGLTALIQIDGNKIVLSSGETIELESKPLNINGRIYLPLVNVAQVFGLRNGNTMDEEDQDIEWNNVDKTVTINIK